MRWRPSPHLLVLLAWALAALFALRTLAAPKPLGADAPLAGFSATRAAERLDRLVGDGSPHPVGSAANAALRQRLVTELRALDLEPVIDRRFVCSARGVCAWVTNVLAILPGLPGASDAPAIALSAHYDSVSAGPGVADDLQGVAAILECLRALQHERGARDRTHHRKIIALFTEGEEVGLLGARAFAESPAFAEVAVFLNGEARGTAGRPAIFEASPGNHRLVAAIAAARPLPLTTSVAYEVYRRMPNDTDLSVFLGAGAQGLGFGFIGGVRRYHTPRDDREHLDLGSVQVQGAALLAIARALADDHEPLTPTVDAAYIDLAGELLLRWPAPASPPLAALALLAVLGAGLRALRRRQLRGREAAAALGLVALAPVLGALGGAAIVGAVSWPKGPLGSFPAAPGLALAAVATAALALTLGALRPLAARVGAPGLTLAGGLAWAALSLALALTVPGAVAPFLPVSAVFGVGLVLASGRGDPRSYLAVAVVAGGLAATLWLPLLVTLADALGLLGGLLGGLFAWAVTPALPALAAPASARGLRLALAALVAAALAAAIAAAAAPRATAAAPLHANLLHLSDLDSGEARLAAELRDGAALPAAWEPLAPWERAPRRVLPWSRRPLVPAPAGELATSGPRLELADADANDNADNATTNPPLRLRLYAREGAAFAVLLLPEPEALRVGGRALDPQSLGQPEAGARLLTIWGPPAEGVDLEITFSSAPAARAVDTPWIVGDALPQLPPAAAAIASARPPTWVPYQWGDLAIAYRQVFFPGVAPR